MRKLVILCSLILVFACSKDENQQEVRPLSFEEHLEAISGAAKFAEALSISDLELEGHELTFLVPNDLALQKFLDELEVSDFANLKSTIGSEHYNAWIGSHIIPEAVKFENIHSAFVPSMALNGNNKTVYHHIWRDKNLMRVNGLWIDVINRDISIGSSYLHLTNQIQRPATLTKLVRAHSSSFSILDRALQLCNLAPMLNNDQQSLTILAPNDAAFDQFFQAKRCGDLDGFISKYGLAELRSVINSHIVNGCWQMNNVEGQTVSTRMANSPIQVFLENGNLMVKRNNSNANNKAHILLTDISAYNGSLNVIDKVLNLP